MKRLKITRPFGLINFSLILALFRDWNFYCQLLVFPSLWRMSGTLVDAGDIWLHCCHNNDHSCQNTGHSCHNTHASRLLKLKKITVNDTDTTLVIDVTTLAIAVTTLAIAVTTRSRLGWVKNTKIWLFYRYF